MEYFVAKDSIVRKIWGKSDTVLFVFAGASAEFALNKAVDWLYFTGRLPTDPLGRLFSTVVYARKIVFSETHAANKAIDSITAIHSAVESNRGARIPDWAYRDVLFMLIHYSQASFELLERRMSDAEKQELFNVFYRMGSRMGLTGLPANYKQWLVMRDEHLHKDLECSHLSIDLYKQYRKHLGSFRFLVLKEAQKLVVPKHVLHLLKFGKVKWITPMVGLYKFSRMLKLDGVVKALLLPQAYKQQIRAIDVEPVS